MIRISYVGRAVLVTPGEVGEHFHELCTPCPVKRVTEWIEDLSTGTSRQIQTVKTEASPLYWYDTDDRGRKIFGTLAGYGLEIERQLRKRYDDVQVRSLVDDGLGEPDLSKLSEVKWRRRQKGIFAKLLAYRGGMIVCPTGWGKTFMIKLLARVYPQARIVVTVASRDIVQDIYDDLKWDFPRDIGMIGNGKHQPKRLIIAVAQSLHKCPKDASIILADECHTLMTKRYTKIFNRFRRAKIFGFTATPSGRSDRGEGFGHAVFGSEIANVTYQEGVAGGNVVQLRARIIPSTKGPEVSAIPNKARADQKAIWCNADRNGLIARAVREVEEEIGPDQQLLVMVDKTEHAYCLGQLLPEFAIVTGEPTADRVKEMRKRKSMTADQEICTKRMREEYRKAFEAHELKRAIATGVWSKGVDFRDLAVLVRADGGGSPINSGQVPGRLSRLGRKTQKVDGLLIDFFDNFSRNLRSRSESRIRVYRQNGYEIERVK